MDLPRLKDLLSDSAAYWLGIMLNKMLGFIFIPLYTRHLSPAEYGVLQLVALTADFVAILVAMQLQAAVFKYYHDARSEEERAEYIGTAFLALVLVSSLVLGTLVWQAGLVSQAVMGSPDYAGFFRLMFGGYFFAGLAELCLAVLRVRRQKGRFVAWSFLNLLLMLGLNIYFVAVKGWGVYGIVLSPLLSFPVMCAALIPQTVLRPRLSWSAAKARQLLAFGLPLIPSGLGMFCLHFCDRYFLRHYGSLADVGLYALGYKFGFLINVLAIQPFNLMWQPQQFAIAKDEGAKHTYARLCTYFLVGMLAVGLALSLFSRDALALLTTPAYVSAAGVVPLIILGYVFYGLYMHFQVGLLVTGRTAFVGATVALAALVNVGLNLLLIPRLGMWGAAVSTAISFGVMSLAVHAVAQRAYRVDYEYPRMARVLAAAVVAFLPSLWLKPGSLSVSLGVHFLLLLTFPALVWWGGLWEESEKELFRAARYSVKKQVLGWAGLS